MSFAKGLHLLALAVWFGSMAFFSFVVAPTVFRNFPRETAGEIVGHIFPKYYVLGTAAGLATLVTLAVVGGLGHKVTLVKLAMVVAMLAMQGTAGYVIRPKAVAVKAQIQAVAPGDEVAAEGLRKEFGALHRNAMILNSIVILLGAAILILSGWNP